MSTKTMTVEQELANAKRGLEAAQQYNVEYQARIGKLEEELRPHREREYKEKERLANEKRAAESEQRLIDNLVGIEALVTKHVKDPLLRKPAFEFALQATMMRTYLR
jgi:hypothetical protein